MTWRVPFAICTLILVLGTSVLARSPIIDYVDPDHFHISPNGDGRADSMIIEYVLVDTATALHLLILESDTSTVVDTLVPGSARSAGVTYSATWNGTFPGGTRGTDAL